MRGWDATLERRMRLLRARRKLNAHQRRRMYRYWRACLRMERKAILEVERLEQKGTQ